MKAKKKKTSANKRGASRAVRSRMMLEVNGEFLPALSVAEVAERCATTKHAIRAYISAGVLPAQDLGGSRGFAVLVADAEALATKLASVKIGGRS